MTSSWGLEWRDRLLGELLQELAPFQKYVELGIQGITLDSREVGSGFLFLACAGARHHGLDYVDEVVRRGAACILAEPDTHWSVDRIETGPTTAPTGSKPWETQRVSQFDRGKVLRRAESRS